MKMKVVERILLISICVLCSIRLLLGIHLRAMDLTIETADTHSFWLGVSMHIRLIVIILLPVLWLVRDKRKQAEEQVKTAQEN